MTAPRRPLTVALLLSTRYFEDFYGAHLGLSREAYLEGYRNDWSWDWVQMLAAEGVGTSIVMATLGPAERTRTVDGVDVRFLALGALARPWIVAPALGRTPPGRWIAQLAMTAAFLRPLRAALARDGVDVLCVQEYWTGRFDLLTRVLEIPVVAVDQGLPDRREIKWGKHGSFARARGAIVQTEREAEKLRSYGADAVRIPNAVRAGFYTPEPRRVGPPRVVSVGRLHDVQKRVSDLLRAVARLEDEADWRVDIAGTGPDEPMLRRIAAELGLADRVRFIGFVSDRAQIRDLYRSATVFAIPSAYEGLPMTLLEAMSCGTAVVGSRIPAIAEVIEDGRTGLLVPVGDPEALARALRDARAERSRLGAAAREEIIEHYDQAVIGPRLRTFLESTATVDGAPGPRVQTAGGAP